MKISIPKNIISDLPQVTFPGNIYVIDSMSKMSMAVNALRKERFVGFDSETRPAFFKGKTNKVALLQISSLDDCFLFRINKIGIPEKLKQFIEDESVKKIGLSLNNDFNAMGRFADITPRGFIDIQVLAKQFYIADMSLQRIYAILFNKKISKSQRLSNWEAPTLTQAQQQYAAIDAMACLEIFNYLESGLFKPELSQYIVNEEITEPDEKQ